MISATDSKAIKDRIVEIKRVAANRHFVRDKCDETIAFVNSITGTTPPPVDPPPVTPPPGTTEGDIYPGTKELILSNQNLNGSIIANQGVCPLIHLTAVVQKTDNYGVWADHCKQLRLVGPGSIECNGSTDPYCARGLFERIDINDYTFVNNDGKALLRLMGTTFGNIFRVKGKGGQIWLGGGLVDNNNPADFTGFQNVNWTDFEYEFDNPATAVDPDLTTSIELFKGANVRLEKFRITLPDEITLKDGTKAVPTAFGAWPDQLSGVILLKDYQMRRRSPTGVLSAYAPCDFSDFSKGTELEASNKIRLE